MKNVVVKVGGEVVASPEMDAIADDVRGLVAEGHRVAIVHGGGPQATALQRRLGLEPRMIAGKRYTDAATLEVMKYVVAGQLNVDVCAKLLAHGVLAVGLHGASGHVIQARRRPPRVLTGRPGADRSRARRRRDRVQPPAHRRRPGARDGAGARLPRLRS
jgi:acetylglutamate kinase